MTVEQMNRVCLLFGLFVGMVMSIFVSGAQANSWLSSEQAFLQTLDKITAFSGWMFASSPAVSSLEHPVYDVTLLACAK